MGLARWNIDVLATESQRGRRTFRRTIGGEIEPHTYLNRLRLIGRHMVPLHHMHLNDEAASWLKAPRHPPRKKRRHLPRRPGETMAIRVYGAWSSYPAVPRLRILFVEATRRGCLIDSHGGVMRNTTIAGLKLQALDIACLGAGNRNDKIAEDVSITVG